MEDESGRPIPLMYKAEGHVIEKFDREGRFVVNKPKCAFAYSEKIETQALMFLAADAAPSTPLLFDMKQPAIVLYSSRVEMDFSASEIFLDGSFYRLVIETCSNRVLSHAFVAPPP